MATEFGCNAVFRSAYLALQTTPEWFGGSRRRFVHPAAPVIALHTPHPGNIVRMCVVDELSRVLNEEGLI